MTNAFEQKQRKTKTQIINNSMQYIFVTPQAQSSLHATNPDKCPDRYLYLLNKNPFELLSIP